MGKQETGKARFEELRFFYDARGSLLETLSGFVAAHAIGNIDDEQLAWARQTTSEAAAGLNGYINYIREQKQGAEIYGDKYVRETEVAHEFPTAPQTADIHAGGKE